jgi:hypothetical protein
MFLALLLPLGACGALVPDYIPNIVPVKGMEKQASDDETFCAAVVAQRAASHHFTWNSVKKVASGGGQGIGSNAGLGATGVVGPLLGGAGGAGTAALQELEITDADSPATLQSCLLQRRADDHAFILGEPLFSGTIP